ncbi:MAG: hypothetical protein A3H98_01120 [Bacteroidetes bacterium RIFCSPLOWO2_02_FULL_36_8]|nr:MAG: hypothetical protein A3H98_01120 [Bacteroidetes bacterium RIFCSPLOWO2_02_FULL_36_8]OFY68860.1 MAG: hypothetical protein A3G23_03480 [Bacteroidetes bacterium RIFCSPLOWO2_12_FULL_37_12]
MNKETDQLIRLLSLEDNPETMRKFLFDLLTPKELLEMSNRWKAAKMLSKRNPYTEIEFTTGLSSATIARISKWLKTGNKGYQAFMERMLGLGWD